MANEYFKTTSNFVLKRKHQNTNLGTIWERNWVTTNQPSVGRFEVGERLWYGDSNFIFTTNYTNGKKIKYNTSNWVAHLKYNDVKDSKPKVNQIKPNYMSNMLSDFAYYGSVLNLMEKSVENIVKNFPGQMVAYDVKLFGEEEHDCYQVNNDFNYNLLSSDFIEKEESVYNQIRNISDYFSKYVIIEEGNVCPINNYFIKDSLDDLNNSIDNYTTTSDGYVKFRDGIYKWIEECNSYVKIDINTNEEYFNSCNTLLAKGDKYYQWVDEKFCYEEVPVKEICDTSDKLLYNVFLYYNYGGSDEKIWQFDIYNIGGEIVYGSKTPNITLRPNNETIEDYFNNLDDFEKLLLRRDSYPLYTNRFIKFTEAEDGNYLFSEKILQFPSDNEYCISVSGYLFEQYISDIVDIAKHYDEMWTDNLWRSMTHESIKNFDWTYRREFAEDDNADNIEGGLQMQKVLGILGYTYDKVKRYIDGIKFTNNVTYNGFNNLPEAQMSDMTDMNGIESYSTIWQPYEYIEITKEEMPEYNYGTSVYLPPVVTGNSPEYLQVGYVSPKYYKRITNEPSKIIITDDYIYGENNGSGSEGRFYVEKIDPWIRKNHAGYAYQYVGMTMFFKNPCDAPPPDYWNNDNTFDEEPPTDVDEYSPLYVRVRNKNFGYYYFKRVENFDNSEYLHDKWYYQVNKRSITPLEVDLEFQKRLFLSSKRIAKSKGTTESIEMLFALFGLERGVDYDLHEYYYTTTPKKLDDTYYFYEQLSEMPIGVVYDDTNTYTSIPVNPTADSQVNIRIETDVVGEYIYYHLNGEYTVQEAINLIRTDEFGYEIDDIFENIPLDVFIIDDNGYVAPNYNHAKEYYGDLYYQSKGGWNKKTNTGLTYDYSETSGRLQVVNDFKTLLQINPDLKNGGYIYVTNPYDYLEYNEINSAELSNYFKLIDYGNSFKANAWRNIPVTGDIKYKNYIPKDEYVTHQDYLNIRHLEQQTTTDKGNNPHNGYGEYDSGEEYLQYMRKPFMFLTDNNYLHEQKIKDMAEQFIFILQEHEETKVVVTYGD